jgi:acyl-coenzyme A synthetase/AMP-(fatty) acid ligase
VIEFCKARLADYKCPKTVHFVEDIPKGPTGKLFETRVSANVEREVLARTALEIGHRRVRD